MFRAFLLINVILSCGFLINCNHEEFCYKDNSNCQEISSRYLLYDVNSSEGFNLRRDVYMRLAVLAHKLRLSKKSNLNSFKLVLPPWSYLVHWKHKKDPEFIPWSYYFDLDSLKKFAPVIEMYEFLKDVGNKKSIINIDEVYILQHFEDMFESGNFEDRMEIQKCVDKYMEPSYLYYDNITSSNVKCLSFHGPALKLTELLEKSVARNIYLDHAEITLHDMFGNSMYWQARRSMRFNKELVNIAKQFREKYLNSNDNKDKTELAEDWTKDKLKRSAVGGPYLAVHMRRNDFVRNRPNETPNLENAIRQIIILLEKLNLDTVFVATDGPKKDFLKLQELTPSKYKILKYEPDEYVKNKFQDGGIAIIDQIICSHGRYFLGTQESTFSFRIQEEREILGFPVKTTFNSFCNDKNICKKPSVWKIVY